MHPTSRGWAILAVALLFYFFANQTQVGWLYVLCALTLGLWVAAGPLPRQMVKGLQLTRALNGSTTPAELELAVGDPVTLTLTFTNSGRITAWQVRGVEQCAFAPKPERQINFFLTVPGQQTVQLDYLFTCARRGHFTFPPVTLTTAAPFGWFRAARVIDVPTTALIFPEARPLKRLPLFDRIPATQNILTRIGYGSEFVGVREYRPGDSPRHVHWRSTARAGQLIVKEFAEETQPGLTIALDLRAASVIGEDEDTSLELAIQVAATLARYAARRALPVTLATNSRDWPAPAGALSEWGVLNYLARVQGAGDESFVACLNQLRATPFVAALLPAPDLTAIPALIEMRRCGLSVLAICIDPTPFLPAALGEATRAHELVGALKTAGVSACVIQAGTEWEEMLSRLG